MTAPVVGQVSVELLAEASKLAKDIREKVTAAFKDLNLRKVLREQLGNTPLKVPVSPDFDTDSIPEKVRKTRAPKVPVEVDPLMAAFVADVKRQTAALAKTANANIPVGADTSGIRAQIGASLAAVQKQLKAQIPTEPAGKAEYEAKLRALVDAAGKTVKANIKVDVDKDRLGGIGSIASSLAGITKAIPGIGQVTAGLSDVVASIQKVTASSAQMGGGIIGAVETATGPIGLVVGAFVAAAAAATALFTGIAAGVTFVIPAITALAGTIAAIPAALAGVGAGVGTLLLGFKGIGEALSAKKTGGGGGSSGLVDRARQVAAASRQVEAARRGIAAASRGVEAAERNYANAERELAKAQDRARQAQVAVNQARVDAVEDIEDLNRALRGARIGEAEAAQALHDAELALNEAKLGGNIPEINRAQNAYDRAQLSLEEAADAADDLQKQTDKANKAGVAGSDRVQAALRDQADAADGVRKAQEGVLDAQNGLISAQDSLKSATDGLISAQDSLAQSQKKMAGGAGAVGAALTKLAPNAQRVVDVIKKLKPAFEDLRLDVQQKLFAGLDKTILRVGKAWDKPLHRILGGFATMFNGFFKDLGVSVSTPKFIKDLEIGTAGFREGLGKIGKSITQNLVPAFGILSRAAGPFLSQLLGGEIGEIVRQFSNWVREGEKTGGLKDFFERAAAAMHELFRTGRTVGSIIGSLFKVLTGASAKEGEQGNALKSFNDGLEKVSVWLKDPQNQEKIRKFIEDFRYGVNEMIKFAGKVKGFIDDVNSAYQAVKRVKDTFLALFGQFKPDTAGEGIGFAAANAVTGGSTLFDRSKRLGSDLVEGLKEGIKEKLAEFDIAPLLWEGPDSLVGKIKKGLGIQSPSTVMMGVGRDVVAGLIAGIGQKFTDLGNRVAQIPGQVRAALGNAGRWLYQHGQSAVSGLGSGITSMFGTLRTWASGLRTTVSNALSNAASWLYDHGRNAVFGLWDGIASLGGWLWNKVVNFVKTNIKKAMSFGLDSHSPSRVTMEVGRFAGEGLALGIESQAGKVRSAADRLAGLAVPQLGDLGFSDAALSAQLQASTSNTLQAAWKPGATGDDLLDALRRIIEFKYNGDPAAAFGS